MAKKLSERNTKNEILEAYDAMLQQLQEAQKNNRKIEKEADERRQKVEEASGMSEENIVKEVSGLKLNINSLLDDIEDSLTREKKKLTRIQEAITSESNFLEDLYEIKANANSLAALIEAQKQQKAAFEEEMKQKKEAFQREITEKQQQWSKE